MLPSPRVRLEITGLVKVLFVSVCVPVSVTTPVRVLSAANRRGQSVDVCGPCIRQHDYIDSEAQYRRF